MPDHDDLFIRWELGQTDADDEAVLATLLQDPAQRRAFARQARIAAALCRQPLAVATRPAAKRSRRVRTPPNVIPRWALAASILLVVGIVALFALHAQPSTAMTPSLAHVEAADGAWILTHDGQRRSAQVGAALAVGETVTTDTGTAIVILGQDVARLELAPGSRLELPLTTADLMASACDLRLTAGQVRADVAPRHAGAPFTISSPVARTEVIGTRFTFSTFADGARLSVERGAVRLSTVTDAGLVVTAGQTAFVAAGVVKPVIADINSEKPLPVGSQVQWRFTPVADPAWRGVVATADDGGQLWASVAPRPGDPWCRAELRSPLHDAGWLVASRTWLRFRYQIETGEAGLRLEVHLKPRDESNYAFGFAADLSAGWHEALIPVDGSFVHLTDDHRGLAVGDRIHGIVWCAMDRDPEHVVRFRIRDALLFTTP